jgi:hypothetical protein
MAPVGDGPALVVQTSFENGLALSYRKCYIKYVPDGIDKVCKERQIQGVGGSDHADAN